jgi:hypothetical protein
MNKRFGAIVAMGGFLVGVPAVAQRPVAADYAANAAAASRSVSAEARQAMADRIEAVNARFRAAHEGRDPEQFGLQCCQITQIPASAFRFDPGQFGWSFDGYLHCNAPGAAKAPVLFPSGVEIAYLDLYYFDNLGSTDLSATLYAFSGGGPFSGAPATSVVATVSSAGAGGYGYATQAVSYTVRNNVAYDPDAADLEIEVNSQMSGLEFKAVDLWWMRQISPAPATATFTDVPTDHPFFAFVEALAAAGITVGYPDGRFGVDDPITRGQMAVFMAKALGLYWPL